MYQALYRAHIAFEDDVLFPTAAAELSREAIRAIGAEMAERRGVDPGRAGPRCRHAKGAPESGG